MKQLLLLPDPRPLVDRLGEAFFREAPQGPGVYLMRDGAGQVLYVGKAKNLRQRLNAYRVANPDRMRRRHLRLLRAATQIELQVCPDERSALARESELLLALKPRFNRAGVWQGPPRYLAWREQTGELELAILEKPAEGWSGVGPIGGRAVVLHRVLVRLIWWSLHPQRGLLGLPPGWLKEAIETPIFLRTGAQAEPVRTFLEKALSGASEEFLVEWLRARIGEGLHSLEQALLEEHLELLTERVHGLVQSW